MISLVVLVVAVILVITAASYAVTIYNGLIVVKNNVPKAWSNIDVLLKQRHDEIPKLVKACEAYMKFEKDTLAKVIELRSAAQGAQGVAAKAQKEGELTAGLHRLFAIAENYPDLKAQSGFQQLQGRISDLENQIADRRELYNESVNNFNVRIETFPDLFVARFLNLRAQELFKVTDAEREDVTLNIQTP